MSPLDRESIQEKLVKLDDIIGDLREYSREATSLAVFVADKKLNGIAMFNLAIGVAIITDVGNHILSAVYHKSAKDSEDVLRLLGEVGVVPKKLVQDNKGMAGFRNVTIHEYVTVNLKKVYTNLKKAPDTFQQFADCYIKFLDKH